MACRSRNSGRIQKLRNATPERSLTHITPPMTAPFKVHAHIMLDDNVVKGLAQCVVAANATTCVEIGSFIGTGSSMILGGLMAARKGVLYCVDTFDINLKSFQGVDASHLDQFTANVTMMGFAPFLRVLKGKSVDVAASFASVADLIYIDANHSEASVKADIAAWLPRLRAGGIMCGDDYTGGDTVRRAVQALLPRHQSMGRLWWAEKP